MGSYLGIDPSNQDKDTQNRNSVTASAGQTLFTATYTPGFLDVYQNGIKLSLGVDFTATNGTSFSLIVPAALGDTVEYVSITARSPWDTYSKAQADIRNGNFYAVAAGSGDSMSVVTTPVLTALADGLEIRIRTIGANTTTTPSITLPALGVAKNVYKYGGQPVQPGDWASGQEITVRYNLAADRFELVSNSTGINKTTLTDLATISWDVSQGILATLTLTGSGRTFSNPTNLKPGTLTLIVKQDATGSRTISTWGTSFKWVAGAAPTLSTTANATDIISFICDGSVCYGTITKNFS